MIYIESSNINKQNFVNLLEHARNLMLKLLKNKKKVTPIDFELVTFEQMVEASQGTLFEGTIRQTGPHDFPDIIANRYFGVEVKMTEGNQWTSVGNSILESSRIEDVKHIYLLFGKFGGELEIKYRPYQECLSEIIVTHSPRYKISMGLAKGNSIFDKMEIDYDEFRKKNKPISMIQDYYRRRLKAGDELWWLGQTEEEKSVSPIIKTFRNLSKNEKENFILDSMILFPEIFGKAPTKFERPAAYLITDYNAVSANLRDYFTAGGQKQIQINNKSIKVSQILFQLHSKANAIIKRINEIEISKLKYFWRCEKLEKDILNQWKKSLKALPPSLEYSLSPIDIFEAGLNEKK